mmetsp:Transcript_10055/g.61061  ORF Transcript_10055/g.61061 Transcript_10055/m.61061 type:complete len:310 (+) Transcript_10055:502-1431(+)
MGRQEGTKRENDVDAKPPPDRRRRRTWSQENRADVYTCLHMRVQGAKEVVSNAAETKAGVDMDLAKVDRPKKEGADSAIDRSAVVAMDSVHATRQDANRWTKDRRVPTRWTIGPKERNSHRPPVMQDAAEAVSVNAKKGVDSASKTSTADHRQKKGAVSGSTIVQWKIWDHPLPTKWTIGTKLRSSNRPHPRMRRRAVQPTPTHRTHGHAQPRHPSANARNSSSNLAAKRRERCRLLQMYRPETVSSETPSPWWSSTRRTNQLKDVPNRHFQKKQKDPKALQATRKGIRRARRGKKPMFLPNLQGNAGS